MLGFDGEPGLANHRISIGSLALPLNQLLKATRRIASDIIMAAQKANSGRGRYADAARAIDLQLEQMANACVEIDIIRSLTNHSPAKGNCFHADILSQSDESDCQTIWKAKVTVSFATPPSELFGVAALAADDAAVPSVSKLSGSQQSGSLDNSVARNDTIPPTLSIVGVFRVFHSHPVRLRCGSARRWGLARCSAAEESIERALSVRSMSVDVLLERTSEKPILLWLKKKGERSTETNDKKREHVFRRWDTVLK